MKDTVIELKNVSVSYLHNKRGVYSVKDFILRGAIFSPFEHKTILHDINLTVKRGDTIGIMGKNGEGKSTLLRTIAGILVPDTGTCKVSIDISPLLALGAGMEMELTGIENIKVFMALCGKYHKKTINALIEEVADFSELTTEQLNMPVKMYSTGMVSRLAFSSAIVTQPALLMIDEVLSVGDEGFQKKCETRIHEIKNAGATVLFTSHSTDAIMEVCERGICLKNGTIIYDGTSKEAANEYHKLFI